MKKKILTGLTATLLFGTIAASPASCKTRRSARRAAPAAVDTVKTQAGKSETVADAIARLTDDDYREVAARLGIEVATIKAVVEIEAGAAHEGFFRQGMPIINFDMSMFRKFAGKNGINLSKYYKSHAIVFSRPNAARHGSTQAAQHARLKAARTIHNETAIQGCFWGMFQIGGFNWRRCGCASIDEFVEKMSHSERTQLELFAEFVTNSGMLPHLQKKNWSAFARMYNGASYASRGYHTRLANSYARHKR
ncbi:MAG: N-acetylmuramidase family protein [Paramuribaculum sp.]|nr:N-acetylmuramidase family protein [Paramuribaculum sp.]